MRLPHYRCLLVIDPEAILSRTLAKLILSYSSPTWLKFVTQAQTQGSLVVRSGVPAVPFVVCKGRAVKPAMPQVNQYSYKSAAMLGKGTFGTVFAGKHKQTGEKVAIKVFSKRTNLECCTDEWLSSQKAALKLPRVKGLVYMHCCFDDEWSWYVVMDLAGGRELFEEMYDRGALPVADICSILEQALEATQVLHNRGYIHRDIKTENMMVSRSNLGGYAVQLVDMDTLSIPDNACETLCGTDGFSAPECYMGRYSYASDIFALGAVGWSLANGINSPYDCDVFEIGGNLRREPAGAPSNKLISERLLKYAIDWSHTTFQAVPAFQRLLQAMVSNDAEQRPSVLDALGSLRQLAECANIILCSPVGIGCFVSAPEEPNPSAGSMSGCSTSASGSVAGSGIFKEPLMPSSGSWCSVAVGALPSGEQPCSYNEAKMAFVFGACAVHVVFVLLPLWLASSSLAFFVDSLSNHCTLPLVVVFI